MVNLILRESTDKRPVPGGPKCSRWLTALVIVMSYSTAWSSDSQAQPTFTYLALGDSYTIGQSVAIDERWPHQFAEAMRAYLPMGGPDYLARSGWTTRQLITALDTAQLRAPYNYVTVLIGANDQFRGGTAAQYEVDLRELLEKAVGLAGGSASNVIVVSIPDYGVTPFGATRGPGLSAAVDEFNAVNRRLAEEFEMSWVDVTEISRAPASRGLLSSDGLHPSGAQYALWAAAIASHLTGE